MPIALKLRVTFEAEGVVSQSIVIDCPHGIPGQLTRVMNEEQIEDTLGFIRAQVSMANFAMERTRFGKDVLIPAQTALLNQDT